jgi:hypothetical protein
MNTTPAASKARRTAKSLAAVMDVSSSQKLVEDCPGADHTRVGDPIGYVSGNLKRDAIMPIRQKKSLSEYRRRLKQRGFVRLEVHVHKDDAPLVRGVVTALADPSRESETRALLRERFGASKATGLKALLVSAPLEGIDLSRTRDFGRDVVL